MSVDLVIGCPVKDRAWILPEWFKFAKRAAENTGMKTKFLFVVDPRSSNDIKVIEEMTIPSNVDLIFIEDDVLEYKRNWKISRYEHMVYLRNTLLDGVRSIAPDFFLSLDTDILIHPKLINNFMENIHRFNAIGGKAHLMSTGLNHPSYANFNSRNNLVRKDFEGVARVDVIMAVKFMSPSAYNIDYSAHKLGEDIGWSNNCRTQGLTLGFDGRLANLHVMNKKSFGRNDKRVSWIRWNEDRYEDRS